MFLLQMIVFIASMMTDVPVLYQGRVRPLGVVEQQENLGILPCKNPQDPWAPLETLRDSETNFTPYPNFEKIRAYYLSSDENLANELLEGYQTLAGKPMLKASGKTLFYPTIMQLKFETIFYRIPFVELVLIFYIGFILKTKWKFLLYSGFIIHTLVLAIRCFVLKRPPVTNMAETLIYVPWLAVFVGIVIKNRHVTLASVGGAILLLIILLMTKINQSMENVQAVLDSQYWLIVHVLMVVGSYAMYLIAGILGHFQLWDSSKKHLEKVILQFMYAGTTLLIPGTILGGVWAAESWGRFWDWDPKEAWAFISSCMYLIWIHLYRFGFIKNFGLALGATLGFLTITFTWYGVNYILGTGLHSYGFGHGGEIYYFIFLAFELIFIALCLMKHYTIRLQKS